MKQVPYWGPTNIRCHHTKFSHPELDAWDLFTWHALFTDSLTHSLTHSLTLSHSLTQSFIHSFIH